MITSDFSVLKNRSFDVCVVGSGPVGSCLAIDLAHRGLSVLVLESGLDVPLSHFQSLGNALIESQRYHHPMSAAVSRMLGGTSSLWGGRCVPLDEIDFVKREFLSNSGWPITYTEVAQHERRAAELLGCDDGGFSTDDLVRYEGNEIEFGKLERWVNETRISRLKAQLKSNDRIVILLNATAVGICVEAGAQAIKGIKVAREGETAEFNRGHKYVLALGGVETARLLLNVQTEHPQLFGGVGGALGRYYMGHIGASFAKIRFFNPDQAAYFSNLNGTRSFSRRRLTFTAKTQLEHKLPNMAFWPENAPLSDPEHQSGFLSFAYLLLKSRALNLPFIPEAIWTMQTATSADSGPHFRNLFNDFGGLIAGTVEFGRQRFLYGRRSPRLFVKNPAGIYPLRVCSEQSPNPNNRVRLAFERDRLGMNRVIINLAFTPQDIAPIKNALKVFDRSIKSLNIGQLMYDKNIQSDELLSVVAPDGLHQIGLTRMSNDPSTGVVDRNCQIFDLKNLYIAGSSVFPTAGQAGPTFPAVALAMRLSENISHGTVG